MRHRGPRHSDIERFAPALAAFALLATMLTQAAAAHAQDKEQCVQAYEEAQTLRVERKLIEAHEKLVLCTNASCPNMISQDCWHWLGEVEAAMPAITIGAEQEGGGDLLNATITLDGNVLTGDWNGKALPVNPGPHSLRAEAEGFHPTEQTVVAREGERSRLVKLVLKPIQTAADASTPAAVSTNVSTAQVEAEGRRLTWPTYTLGGVAIASVGVGAYFGYKGTSDAKDMKKECGGNCAQSDIDSARTKLIVANVLFGVGGAAAVGALITYLVSKPKAPEAADGSDVAFGFDVNVDRAGGMAVLRGSY